MNFSIFDHQCMAEALRLARKGLYTTDPNPRVGCVISQGDKIIGRGWHQAAGGPHAEVAALSGLTAQGTDLTVYVTLEPCAYQGRTPPCTDALLAHGVARVVVGSLDPNPLVNGRGIEKLRQAGVRVETGLMKSEAQSLNPGFNKRMKQGLPWVRIKSAISLDGRTALQSGESKWISSAASRQDVQHWRARSSAILTGIGTVLADDPSMTARVNVPVVQPIRVIVDSNWRTPPGSKLLAASSNTLVAGDCSVIIPADLASRAECHGLAADGQGVDLVALLHALAERQVNEVQVEAGSRLCGALLGAGLVDEVLIYQAPIVLGDGGPGIFAMAPLESMNDRTHFKVLETVRLGGDLRILLQTRACSD